MHTHIAAASLCGLLIAGSIAAAGEEKENSEPTIAINMLRESQAIRLLTPATPDSLDGGMNAFKREDLLKKSAAGINPAAAAQFSRLTADWTTILPDTAGNFTIHAGNDAQGADAVRIGAAIRPSAFFSGKVRLRTPMSAILYLDGKKIGENLSPDSAARDIEAPLTLMPYQDAVIEAALLRDASDKGSPTVALSLLPDKDSQGVEVKVNPDKRYFNLDATVSGPRISSVELSPDGKYMIVATSETNDNKDFTYSYDIRRCDNGEVTSMNFGEGLSWMPGKNSTLYGTVERHGGGFDIQTIEYPSMHRVTIASGLPDEAADFTISPSGDYIVYMERVKDERKSGVMNRITSPDDRIPGNADRYYLNMIRLSDGAIRPLTRGGATTYLADISPKGDKILYIASRETPSRYPFYESSLVELDVKTLRTDTLRTKEPGISSAAYSPDASRIFITAGPSFADSIGANAGPHPIPNDFDIQGYVLDIPSRKVKAVTREFDPSISGTPVWNGHDNRIYFLAEKGFDKYVFSLNPTDGEIRQITRDIDYTRNFSIGNRESRWLAYTGMSYTYMGRARLLDLKSGTSRIIADPMADIIADTKWGEYEMWNFTAPDGSVIEGYQVLPPDFNPENKYPLIVYYYGGTAPSNRTNHSPYSPELLASRGYVVYVLNPSGTTGYGQEFSARHVNAWGDRTADEIIYGTKLFCEKHPYINASKIGCMGASYGGFMTQLLISRTDIFAAAVSHAGISNVASYWGEGFWGYSYNSVAAATSYPWSNPDIYTRNSSLFNADKINTPLLLLHGTVDTNVPIGESIQLYNALKILGREVEFITVSGENHIIMDFEKRREWHNTIMAWFEKWLKDDPRWWNSLYDK